MDFKKILVALSEGESSDRAVAYVGEIIRDAQGFCIELLAVHRPASRDLFPDQASWEQAARDKERELGAYLEKSRDVLLSYGTNLACISTRIMACTGDSIARDILAAQREGGFGTVVVGRRGVPKSEEFLFGSVSRRVVTEAKGCTVWVVE